MVLLTNGFWHKHEKFNHQFNLHTFFFNHFTLIDVLTANLNSLSSDALSIAPCLIKISLVRNLAFLSCCFLFIYFTLYRCYDSIVTFYGVLWVWVNANQPHTPLLVAPRKNPQAVKCTEDWKHEMNIKTVKEEKGKVEVRFSDLHLCW